MILTKLITSIMAGLVIGFLCFLQSLDLKWSISFGLFTAIIALVTSSLMYPNVDTSSPVQNK